MVEEPDGLTDEDRRNCALLCLLGKVILYSRTVFMIVKPKVRGFNNGHPFRSFNALNNLGSYVRKVVFEQALDARTILTPGLGKDHHLMVLDGSL